MLSGTDTLLLSPTGTGKSLTYVGSIAMKRQDNPKSVLLLSVPLSLLAEEKMKTHALPTTFLTIAGKFIVNEDGEEENDATLADNLEAVLAGDFAIICGHGEAFLTTFGRWLVKEFVKRRMLGIVVFDEAHKNLRWKMRPDMLEAPAVLKALCSPTTVFLYLTATMRQSDINESKKQFCMSSNIAIISASPILPNHFFINIKRPSNDSGYEGKIMANGEKKQGLKHVLDVLLQPWKSDLLKKQKPVLTMLFCKVISAIHPSTLT